LKERFQQEGAKLAKLERSNELLEQRLVALEQIIGKQKTY
jgi:hypothetical protein